MKAVIVALSAKQVHKSLAPWCLKAACDARLARVTTTVLEHSINDSFDAVLTALYRLRPDVAGFSCYIWNIDKMLHLARQIKKLLPDIHIILGGPEVSFDEDYPEADYLLQGEGEQALPALLEALQSGKPPKRGRYAVPLHADFAAFPSPFTESYFASCERMGGMKNLLVYYESCRGCPFSCAYCLSSATEGVRYLPLERVFTELTLLVERGAHCIKFVDRTFNANKARAKQILRFVAALDTDCTFHFEVAADLFDAEMLQIIAELPPARVQFEAGIQSVHPDTLDAVCRKTDLNAAFCNITRLAEMQNCHIHVDLIAGLPRETLDTFKKGVDACLAARPHMLQLGFLKLLKGSPLRAQNAELGFVFDDAPPYEVFSSPTMPMDDLMRLKDIEALIDKYYNSGLFANAVAYGMQLLGGYGFFEAFSKFPGRAAQDKISLKNAYARLLEFLCAVGDAAYAQHLIKLDCLLHDSKGMLPDAVPQLRDKQREAALRSETRRPLRVEHFPYDGTTRVFWYDHKHPVTLEYFSEGIPSCGEAHKMVQ